MLDCQQDYCKSNQPISVKLVAMNGPTNKKNWLTFGGNKGGAENDGHEIAGHEIDGPSCRA